MPRYYFQVFNDDVTTDEDGMECADDGAALIRAQDEARNLAADSIRRHGHLILDHRIEVRNEEGLLVGEVRFGQAVDIRESS